MKITIESTEKIVTLVMPKDGVKTEIPARIWEGHTDSGIPVHCFVTRIAPTVEDTEENKKKFVQFERELMEQRKPSTDVYEIPLRLIL